MGHAAVRLDPESKPDWQSAHEALVRIAGQRASLDREEGCWLLLAYRSGAHLRLGFASFREYVERLLGHSPRRTEEKLRVAEALERLQLMDAALENGILCWSAVRELTRVATEQTEAEWLEASRGRTVREVERLVSRHLPGDRPSDPPRLEARRRVVRFELSAEAFATLREAFAKLRREAGGSLDDDAAILLMARQVLQGPIDTGRSSYQVRMTVCELCGRGSQQGKGEEVPVPPDVVDMVACDAQVVRDGPRKPAAQGVPPATRREVMRRHGGRCAVPGCVHAVFVDVHHVDARADGGTHDPDRLVVLCSAHHRAVHRGRLLVEGDASSGFVFRHADGSPYGQVCSPSAVDAAARVFVALGDLGFSEREAREVVAAARAHVGETVSFEVLLREALSAASTRASPGKLSDSARPSWSAGARAALAPIAPWEDLPSYSPSGRLRRTVDRSAKPATFTSVSLMPNR